MLVPLALAAVLVGGLMLLLGDDEPDTGRSVNRTELQIDLPETVADDLRSTLAPQDDFCRQRFANMLPASWRA